MKNRIIFVPVCERCGYEFKRINVKSKFTLVCPKCKNLLYQIVLPDPNKCIISQEEEKLFRYNKRNFY